MTGEDDVTLRLSRKAARIIGRMVPHTSLLNNEGLIAGIEYYNELLRTGVMLDETKEVEAPKDKGGVHEV